MLSSDNKELKEMVETLLKQELENRKNKVKDDQNEQTQQTIIHIEHSLSTYALLYLLLGQHSTTASQNVGEDSNFTVQRKFQKMIEDIALMQENNQKFYLEVLEKLQ